MKISSIKILSIIIFIIICCSLFLPQYETLTDGMLDEAFSFLSQYPNPDQSGGFSGGGYYSIYNGFGSINTILTVIISFFITIMILNERLSRKLILSLIVFMIILYLLSFLEVIMAPFLLSDPDRLKIGFYNVRLLEMALFSFAFIELKQLNKAKLERTDLIDN